MALAIGIDDVRAAAVVLEGEVVRTPTVRAPSLSRRLGCELWLKLENLQVTGSFKARGALYKLASLPAEARANGVIAISAGNHAQGVAYHAGRLGIPATIVMPQSAPFTKIEATERHGARVILHGDGLADCIGFADELAAREALTPVHPYDDPAIMAGQGTVGLEMLADAPDLDTLVVPVGGGGLIAGIAVAAKALRPQIRIVGVQSDRYPTFVRGGPDLPGGATLAEGIAVARPGALTGAVIAELVDEVLQVTDSQVEQAISLLAEVGNVVAEGAGAAGVAAMLAHNAAFAGCNAGAVVCGGNIDNRVLASILTRGLIVDGRLVRLRIQAQDRPGALARIVDRIAAEEGNIVDVAHHRLALETSVKHVDIEFLIETRSRAHGDAIVAALAEIGTVFRTDGAG